MEASCAYITAYGICYSMLQTTKRLAKNEVFLLIVSLTTSAYSPYLTALWRDVFCRILRNDDAIVFVATSADAYIPCETRARSTTRGTAGFTSRSFLHVVLAGEQNQCNDFINFQ